MHTCVHQLSGNNFQTTTKKLQRQSLLDWSKQSLEITKVTSCYQGIPLICSRYRYNYLMRFLMIVNLIPLSLLEITVGSDISLYLIYFDLKELVSGRYHTMDTILHMLQKRWINIFLVILSGCVTVKFLCYCCQK